jgi:hypothetical protein
MNWIERRMRGADISLTHIHAKAFCLAALAPRKEEILCRARYVS